ncbi:MAG: DUF1045 domain-containing protein [Candidatus Adiutrix sp.]|jgi:2'-5' RNA ligase|nr:DUF1045 domain-containing protein [Candidatus Adiutrix sp.]
MAGRYAVYFVPPEQSEFYRLGATLLGRSVFSENSPQLEKREAPPCPDREYLTAEPRFYGFHGTIKAPFELNGSKNELMAALAKLAAETRPFKLPPLKVSFVEAKFLALTLSRESRELADLEKKCLVCLRGLSAPLSPADIERRGRLAPRLAENLKNWGYHLVLDDFKFHMTLTGPVDSGRTAAALIKFMEEYFQPVLARENIFGALTLLYQEDRERPFTALKVFPLNGE